MKVRWKSDPWGWMLVFKIGGLHLVFVKDVHRGLPTSYCVRGWWE